MDLRLYTGHMGSLMDVVSFDLGECETDQITCILIYEDDRRTLNRGGYYLLIEPVGDKCISGNLYRRIGRAGVLSHVGLPDCGWQDIWLVLHGLEDTKGKPLQTAGQVVHENSSVSLTYLSVSYLRYIIPKVRF